MGDSRGKKLLLKSNSRLRWKAVNKAGMNWIMATKAATFSAKIRNLTDFHQRLVLNSQPPSGLEIVNTLRYFQQSLIGFLKDIQTQGTNLEGFKRESSEIARSTLFPNLNYSGLYYAINNLTDVYASVSTGQIALGHSILVTLKCLYIFLERDLIDQLPYNLANLLNVFPKELHQDIMHLLCNVILPFTLDREENDTYATLTIPAVIMMVFHYSAEASHHCWLVETLMTLRRDIYKDILAVIAMGTSESRIPGANLLFHYWPLLHPQILDRKAIQYKPHAWAPVRCEHRECSSGNAEPSPSERPSTSAGISSLLPASSSAGSLLPLGIDTSTPSNVGDAAAQAVKKCFDPFVCAESGDTSPPMLLCKVCSEKVQDSYKVPLNFIVQPMATVNTVCQNKGCQSNSRLAVSTCFSSDCIRSHHHFPIRLCQECHEVFHGDAVANEFGMEHMVHTRLPIPWDTDLRTARNTIEAIIKLLKETSYMLEEVEQEKRPKWLQQLEGREVVGGTMADERRMLSRFGIWLLAGLCTPREDTPKESVAQLLSMLFQWFATTALLPNDAAGTALEQLKTDFVCNWMQKVLQIHYEVFVECMMPTPPEYARVGGLWDKLASKPDRVKEGLSKLLALIPYDVISLDLWERIMPEWLECICNDIGHKSRGDLKVLLCKIFEVDMCPLPFPVSQIYNFIGIRLEKGTWQEELMALDWIQLLTEMDILIPLDVLLGFCASSAHRMAELSEEAVEVERKEEPEEAGPTQSKSNQDIRQQIVVSVASGDSIVEQELILGDDEERYACPLTPEDSPIRRPRDFIDGEDAMMGDSNAAFFAAMMDVLLRQMTLAEQEEHVGTSSNSNQQLLIAAVEILAAPWRGSHVCHLPEYDDFVDCGFCQETTVFFELLMDLVRKLCPKLEVKIEMPPEEDYDWALEAEPDEALQTSVGADGSVSAEASLVASLDPRGAASAGLGTGTTLTVMQPLVPQIVTATEQMEDEEVEFVGILPTEEVETAMAQTVTLTETDVGMATCKVVSATVVDEEEGGGMVGGEEEEVTFWYTSLGKFRFTLEELPGQLRLVYALMINVENYPDPDAQYFLLHSMKFLCLHAEALSNSIREYRGFLIWAQENLLIPKFWRLLRSEYSQIAHISVPLMIHSLTLPSGADMLWKVTNEDFTSDDWTVRFAAVEKVLLICQFLDPSPIRGNLILQGALANAFCFLVAAVQDPNSAVAQKALLLLETIRTSALKCLTCCLEAQFDAVILDRPLILHRLSLLTCLMPKQPILSWDFFLQRFDVLAMEAQIRLEQSGEIAMAQDLMHTDPLSDIYSRKVNRAKEALEENENIRSIVRHLEKKAMRYQTTISLKVESQPARGPPRKRPRKSRPSSVRSEAALSGRRKLQKVVTMMRVVRAWKGIRTRLKGSISSISSIISGGSSAMGRRSSPGEVLLHVDQDEAKMSSPFSSPRASLRSPSRASRTGRLEPGNADLSRRCSLNSYRESEEDEDDECDEIQDVFPPMVPGTSRHSSFLEAKNVSRHSSFGEPKIRINKPADFEESRTKKTAKNDADYTLGKLREFTDEESNFCLLLNKALDLENKQRHTVHLIITLFMKFLSMKTTTLSGADEKATAKKQSMVLRHLNVLLGYSATERSFTVPPQKLRISSITNAFLSGLPKVLDSNLVFGNQILPIATKVLQYIPSPQRYASDNQPPNYSLWLLEAHTRHSWLWTLLLILYKYRFEQPPINENVITLIKLVLNTLDGQAHRCHAVEKAYKGPLFYSRVPSCVIPPITTELSVGNSPGNSGGHGISISPFGTKPHSTTTSACPSFHASPATSTPSTPVRMRMRLRHVFSEVLLLVRVMKLWPRGSGRLFEDGPISRPPSVVSPLTLHSRRDDGSSSASETDDDEDDEVRNRSSASERYERRKARHKPQRQPTFDEREEAILEESPMERLDLESGGDFTSHLIRADVTMEKDSLVEPNQIYFNNESQVIEIPPVDSRSFTSPSSMGKADRIDSVQAELERLRIDSPEEMLQPEMLQVSVSVQPAVHTMEPGLQTISSDLIIHSQQHIDNNGFQSMGQSIAVKTPILETSQTVPMRGELVTPNSTQMQTMDEEEFGGMVECSQAVEVKHHVVEPMGLEIKPMGLEIKPMEMLSMEMKPIEIKPTEMRSMEMKPMETEEKEVKKVGEVKLQAPTTLNLDSQVISLDSQVLMPIQPTQLQAIGEEEEDRTSINTPTNQQTPRAKSPSSNGKQSPFFKKKPPFIIPPSEKSRDRGQSQETYTPPRHFVGSVKHGEETIVSRCTQCNTPLESYDEETVGMAIVCLSTFVHREPAMAAPFLHWILQTVARVANQIFYPWQSESNIFVAGNCKSVAKQCLRVVLHQMTPNGVMLQLFMSDIEDPYFFETVSKSLQDFNELSPVAAVAHLLDDMNVQWPTQGFAQIMYNLSDYIQHVPTDSYLTTWATALVNLEIFLRRIIAEGTEFTWDISHTFTIMERALRVQNFSAAKNATTLLELMAKYLSMCLETRPVTLKQLLTLCTACSRAFSKERDKQALSRACVGQLLQAIKFKVTLPEANYLIIIKMMLQDLGEEVDKSIDEHLFNTGAAECGRPCISEFLDFISDLHVLNKVKTMARGMGFQEDTLGGDLKAGLAQFTALEISRSNMRDPRTVLRYLPWLLSPPSVTQQGPAEFMDCVTRVRVLSWLLLGALQSSTSSSCLPIPVDISQQISDQIQFVLAGFAEQSKESVVHMSALFHAFHLCQLWTIYCEKVSVELEPTDDNSGESLANVMDFWSRVTPAILQLLSHSKVQTPMSLEPAVEVGVSSEFLADMVNLHFLNTMEALQECNSAVLCRLYPMWQPVLSAYSVNQQLPSHLMVRLDACENQIPAVSSKLKGTDKSLNTWLKRVRFKISQIELQSSLATQMYTV